MKHDSNPKRCHYASSLHLQEKIQETMIVSSDRRSKLRKETREQTHRLHFRTYTTYFHVISRKNQRQAVLNLGRVQRFRAEYVRFML